MAVIRSDAELTDLGWRAVARKADGSVVSLMAPGFFDEYLKWIGDMERLGHDITELSTQSMEG